MIRLEHANLVVKDIAATLHFIQTAFPEWRIRGSGSNTWYGKPRRWVHVGTDDYYLTLNDAAEGENRDLTAHTPGLAHLGFVVDDVEAVIRRLEAKGYATRLKGDDHPFRKTAYFVEPAGFEFELLQYFSENPREKNRYESSGSMTVDPEYLTESAEAAVA